MMSSVTALLLRGVYRHAELFAMSFADEFFIAAAALRVIE